MADFEDMNELKALKARGAIDDEKFNSYQKLIANKIIKNRKEDVYCKNGYIYIVMAFALGTIGIHNFYAGYYKRGTIQLFITLISPYLMYFPLLFTALWALAELLFVNKSANGAKFKGSRAVIWGLRLLALAALWYVREQSVLITEI